MATQTVTVRVLAVKVEKQYDRRGTLIAVRLTSGKGAWSVRTTWREVDRGSNWIQYAINNLNELRSAIGRPELDDEQVSALRAHLS